MLAPAGASARLVVADTRPGPGATVALQIALGEFRLHQGLLPVVPVTPLVNAVTPGMTIAAVTQGSIERANDRVFISVPVPVPLSSAVPSSAYTPVATVTAAPIVAPPRRGATPTPLPTTFNPPDPAATLSPSA